MYNSGGKLSLEHEDKRIKTQDLFLTKINFLDNWENNIAINEQSREQK